MRVWSAVAASLDLEWSPERDSQLAHYEDLLRSYAIPRGMVARGDAERLRSRHIADSLEAAALIAPDDRRAADLGSGAGLPGIVLAVAVPEVEFVLAETRRTRVAFLELAVGELGLPNTTVHAGLISDVVGPFDACFARALGNAADSWAHAAPLLSTSGRLIYFAGETGDLPAGVSSVVSPLARHGRLVIMSR